MCILCRPTQEHGSFVHVHYVGNTMTEAIWKVIDGNQRSMDIHETNYDSMRSRRRWKATRFNWPTVLWRWRRRVKILSKQILTEHI